MQVVSVVQELRGSFLQHLALLIPDLESFEVYQLLFAGHF